MILIILNVVILSLKGTIEKDVIDDFRYFLIFYFTFEIIVRYYACYYRQKIFFQEDTSLIDLMIVIYSWIDYFQNLVYKDKNIDSYFRIFRSFEALRVIRIILAMEYSKLLKNVIKNSISSFLNMTMLLFYFIIIFSLFGMQIFNWKPQESHSKILRTDCKSFQDFASSFITVFNLITLDNWGLYLEESFHHDYKWQSAIFLLVLIIVGNFIFLNLFLTILLMGFEDFYLNSIRNNNLIHNKNSDTLDLDTLFNVYDKKDKHLFDNFFQKRPSLLEKVLSIFNQNLNEM